MKILTEQEKKSLIQTSQKVLDESYFQRTGQALSGALDKAASSFKLPSSVGSDRDTGLAGHLYNIFVGPHTKAARDEEESARLKALETAENERISGLQRTSTIQTVHDTIHNPAHNDYHSLAFQTARSHAANAASALSAGNTKEADLHHSMMLKAVGQPSNLREEEEKEKEPNKPKGSSYTASVAKTLTQSADKALLTPLLAPVAGAVESIGTGQISRAKLANFFKGIGAQTG